MGSERGEMSIAVAELVRQLLARQDRRARPMTVEQPERLRLLMERTERGGDHG